MDINNAAEEGMRARARKEKRGEDDALHSASGEGEGEGDGDGDAGARKTGENCPFQSIRIAYIRMYELCYYGGFERTPRRVLFCLRRVTKDGGRSCTNRRDNFLRELYPPE